jgi:hypothetical protein
VVVHATASHDAHALRGALHDRFPNAVLHGASSCRGVMTERGSSVPAHAHALSLFAVVDPGGLYSGATVPLSEPSAEAARDAGERAAQQALRNVEVK